MKKHNFKLENLFGSGDHNDNKIKTNVNHTRTSVESKLAGQGDGDDVCESSEINSDISENESAYEDSFCSESSESSSYEESESSHVTQASSISGIPKFRFTSSSSFTKQENTNLNRKFASTSKICDDKFLTIEDRIKCMSLNEVRPVGSGPIRSSRKNMSFTNDQVMRIERDNEILLRKIMSQQKPQKLKSQPLRPKLSSSAINRKKYQKKIEEDNLLLLRRLQQAKSCIANTPKTSGCRTMQL